MQNVGRITPEAIETLVGELQAQRNEIREQRNEMREARKEIRALNVKIDKILKLAETLPDIHNLARQTTMRVSKLAVKLGTSAKNIDGCDESEGNNSYVMKIDYTIYKYRVRYQ
jgi:hypothetical protein